MDDRAFASATQLANEIRDRRIGCVELLDFYLARAERHNPALNAIVVWQVDQARDDLHTYGRPMLRGRRTRRGLHAAVKGVPAMAGRAASPGTAAKKDGTRCAGLAATNLLRIDRILTKASCPVPRWNSATDGDKHAVAVYRHRILRGWHIAIKSRVRLDDPGYLAIQPDIRCVARLVLVVIPVDQIRAALPGTGGMTTALVGGSCPHPVRKRSKPAAQRRQRCG